jgi:hypothetical protein
MVKQINLIQKLSVKEVARLERLHRKLVQLKLRS